jgi:hypothetical protein
MANNQSTVKRVQRDLREIELPEMGRDAVQYVREYARENPELAALWCFGFGFVLGWKLKIW